MNKNLIFSLLAAACVISAVFFNQQPSKKDNYSAWKSQFGINWGAEEDAYRKIIFL